jgi:hypothetical protein
LTAEKLWWFTSTFASGRGDKLRHSKFAEPCDATLERNFKTRVAFPQVSIPSSFAFLRRHAKSKEFFRTIEWYAISFMAIVFPNEAVARRWDGALQARLRRAPLEGFLRARGIVPAPPGVAQDSDNLVRATVLIVEAGLKLYLNDRSEGLAAPPLAIVGRVACLVSRSLAELISQPTVWRIVALVSTAQLLTPWIGLNAAAMMSARSTRHFQEGLVEGAPIDAQVGHSATAALVGHGTDAMAEVSAVIAARLSLQSGRDHARFEEELSEMLARS